MSIIRILLPVSTVAWSLQQLKSLASPSLIAWLDVTMPSTCGVALAVTGSSLTFTRARSKSRLVLVGVSFRELESGPDTFPVQEICRVLSYIFEATQNERHLPATCVVDSS